MKKSLIVTQFGCEELRQFLTPMGPSNSEIDAAIHIGKFKRAFGTTQVNYNMQKHREPMTKFVPIENVSGEKFVIEVARRLKEPITHLVDLVESKASVTKYSSLEKSLNILEERLKTENRESRLNNQKPTTNCLDSKSNKKVKNPKNKPDEKRSNNISKSFHQRIHNNPTEKHAGTQYMDPIQVRKYVQSLESTSSKPSSSVFQVAGTCEWVDTLPRRPNSAITSRPLLNSMNANRPKSAVQNVCVPKDHGICSSVVVEEPLIDSVMEKVDKEMIKLISIIRKTSKPLRLISGSD